MLVQRIEIHKGEIHMLSKKGSADIIRRMVEVASGVGR